MRLQLRGAGRHGRAPLRGRRADGLYADHHAAVLVAQEVAVDHVLAGEVQEPAAGGDRALGQATADIWLGTVVFHWPFQLACA